MDRRGIRRLLRALLFLCVSGELIASSSADRVSGEQFIGYTDKQILDSLLDISRYDKRSRPSPLTVVNVTTMLLTLSSPDESSLEYGVEFNLHQKWIDPRLEFDYDGPYQYLNGLTHVDIIWIPDTYAIKHGEIEYSEDPTHMELKIDRNGTVTYTMRRNMVLKCLGNLKIFPFDNVKCPFALESVSHDQGELKLQWEEAGAPLTKASSLQQQNAYLVKSTTGVCSFSNTWRGNFSCLRVLLVFTRDKSFYFTTVFMPAIFLVFTSFISFWLDINEVTGRLMIGLITMVTFQISTNNFRSTLEVTSNLSALNLWDGVCFFLIFASILEFIIANYLYRKTTPPFQGSHSHAFAESRVEDATRAEDITTPASTKQETPTQNHEVQSGKASAAAASVIGWFRFDKQNPSVFIDNISRIVFPIIFVIFVLAFFFDFAIIKPSLEENW